MNNYQISITIIIPVYNASRHISRCLRSILSQTVQDFEVVLVDDASQDDSVAMIRSVVENDSRFVLLEHNTNMGAMRARETGYLNARGDYIMFCDSDDMLPQTALEDLLTAIKTTSADIVVGEFENIDDRGNKTRCRQNKLFYGNDSKAVLKSLLKNEITQSLCGRIFNHNLFDSLLVCKDNFNNAEDALLFYQLVDRASRIATTDKVVYYYYQNQSTNSNTRAQMTEKRAYSIIYFRNFISKYFKGDEELWMLYQHKYLNVIMSLLREGISKQFIVKHATGVCLDYGAIWRSFGGLKRIYALLLFYCKPIRSFIGKITK